MILFIKQYLFYNQLNILKMTINLFDPLEFFNSLKTKQLIKSYFSGRFFVVKKNKRTNEKGKTERLIEDVVFKKQYWITEMECNAKTIML